MSSLVFVYGSLRRGGVHHDKMRGAHYVGNSRVFGAFLVRYEGGYPALVLTPTSEDWVMGEVFDVTSEHLLALDAFEECPRLYQRVSVELEDGGAAEAYIISGDVAARFPRLGTPLAP